MDLIESLEKIEQPYPNAVVTIGNFDGVHIGHQALFHQVIAKADAVEGTSVAMTFEPHPARVLNGDNPPPLITLYEQKVELIARSGIDVLVVIPFTRKFGEISATDFVEKILLERIGMKAVVVGKDYAFGKNREGDLDMLHRLSDRFGFEVLVTDWITLPIPGIDRVSSTRIRELILDGRMEEAKKLLGRDYQVRGTVVKGRDRGGKLLGFPTANIHLMDELCPKAGVYAVTVECLGKRFWGVANIGYSPTFDDPLFTVEVHLLDFNGKLYGEKIRVNFVCRIRDEIRFSGIRELSDQIRKDILKAREILA
ncbi:MAG: bifunctional riboflavin kinase/FAD synthetase [Deltaproteobacteria bacterium]|nr:bifunctional riboflavin kinase/FAD synthetase [Deltaproteobacteria bacterium]MBW2041436.1 bifunctional riboflavin kinase/FAD synthetase [Deltaproteobacteria bacterium]MBW2133006.1 bifunctional riboflavin kinase/FAD synthetase [Deltaproteobacteria bacterium]